MLIICINSHIYMMYAEVLIVILSLSATRLPSTVQKSKYLVSKVNVLDFKIKNLILMSQFVAIKVPTGSYSQNFGFKVNILGFKVKICENFHF